LPLTDQPSETMKFLSFVRRNAAEQRLGVELDENNVFDLGAFRASLPPSDAAGIPASMEELVASGDDVVHTIRAATNDATNKQYVIATTDMKYVHAPVPRKSVFCVGRNYREHIVEGNMANGRPADSFPEAIEFF